MNRTFKIIFFSVFLFFSCRSPIMAQNQDSTRHWKLRVDVFHQDHIWDLYIGTLEEAHKVWIRPGVALSAEYTIIDKGFFRLYQSTKIGFYDSPYEERWFTLGADMGAEFCLFKRLLLAPRVGFHYNLVKATDIRYVFDENQWVRTTNTDAPFSRIQFMPGLDIGCKVLMGKHPLDILAHGNLSASGPYQPGSVPLALYKSIGIGIRMGI